MLKEKGKFLFFFFSSGKLSLLFSLLQYKLFGSFNKYINVISGEMEIQI